MFLIRRANRRRHAYIVLSAAAGMSRALNAAPTEARGLLAEISDVLVAEDKAAQRLTGQVRALMPTPPPAISPAVAAVRLELIADLVAGLRNWRPDVACVRRNLQGLADLAEPHQLIAAFAAPALARLSFIHKRAVARWACGRRWGLPHAPTGARAASWHVPA